MPNLSAHMADLQAQIEELWERRNELDATDKNVRRLVREAAFASWYLPSRRS